MYDYIYFDPLSRTTDGYYSIPGALTHVFAFSIAALTSTTISIVQTLEYVQDFSLKVWFSTQPLDGILFQQFDNLNPLYPLKHAARLITLWDQNLPSLSGVALAFALDPTLMYYINIQNAQGSTNAYRLSLP
jgi:hypothetical protein